ncbi:type IV secretory system conjugative DNA transfer family protein [Kutzneria sp. 744]|uniref:type IV secretory system conjugative DNA transfer family protein n=1 Tax=Kutzneria sp. (strain 744) TaxID=345341 RepID=UPI0004B417FD|nr:TraM recognition domain-containing protein [Kutzneria sp. 744]
MPRVRLGRNRLLTRRERLRSQTGVLLALLGAALSAWIAAGAVAYVSGIGWSPPTLHVRSVLTRQPGGSGLLGLFHSSTGGAVGTPWQSPVTVSWPADPVWSALAAVPVWLVWLRVVCRPVFAGLQRDVRADSTDLASIRRLLGARAVRRAGRYTLPETTWWQRMLLPTTAFGYSLGYVQGHRRHELWADWEQRVRIQAWNGWGKTLRLLVPIIRALPGPALISSTEPQIFESTVQARQFRQRPIRWRWVGLVLRRWFPTLEYPVAVAEFGPARLRSTAGYRRVEWNLIDGSEDMTTALRRALDLVNGIEDDTRTGGDSGNDRFFRDAASEVLAAWLHAAALGDREIDDLLNWQRDLNDPLPRTILADHPRADRTALLALTTHLDSRAANTTSGVARYLSLATRSLGSDEGRDFCGRRFTPGRRTRTGTQLDLEELIRAGGTIYVLAPERYIGRIRPLLAMFCGELFAVAEEVALSRRSKRLALPFIGVHDELRFGVPVPSLPSVANSQRKFGIGMVYAVQDSTQEDEVFGRRAASLRAAAGVSISGGIDPISAEEISRRAGTTPVVTTSRGSEFATEQVSWFEALTIADQQRLGDGQSTVVARGLTPFVAEVRSIKERPLLRRRIDREVRQVTRRAAAARAGDLAADQAADAAASAGTDFGRGDSR